MPGLGHNSTVAQIAGLLQPSSHVSSHAPDSPTLDLGAVVADTARGRRPQNLLITGSTGFLGAYLLAELAQTTDATLWCLVRAATPDAAMTRVQRNLAEYGLWREEFRDRVIPVPGELAADRLGLEPTTYDLIARRIDAIFHLGARVNHIESYARLRRPNVDGTHELLRLAARPRAKHVHYVSTASVAQYDESMEQWHNMSGYVQSKAAAERLVHSAHQRGVSVTIYRPGLISGDSMTGAGSANDGFWILLRAALLLGVAPDGDLGHINMSPVDHVAKELARLAMSDNINGRTCRIGNTDTISISRVLELTELIGAQIIRAPAPEFFTTLTHHARGQCPDPAITAAAALAETFSLAHRPTIFPAGMESTKQVAALDVTRPVLNDDMIIRYLKYFSSTGFLPIGPRPIHHSANLP